MMVTAAVLKDLLRELAAAQGPVARLRVAGQLSLALKQLSRHQRERLLELLGIGTLRTGLRGLLEGSLFDSPGNVVTGLIERMQSVRPSEWKQIVDQAIDGTFPAASPPSPPRAEKAPPGPPPSALPPTQDADGESAPVPREGGASAASDPPSPPPRQVPSWAVQPAAAAGIATASGAVAGVLAGRGGESEAEDLPEEADEPAGGSGRAGVAPEGVALKRDAEGTPGAGTSRLGTTRESQLPLETSQRRARRPPSEQAGYPPSKKAGGAPSEQAGRAPSARGGRPPSEREGSTPSEQAGRAPSARGGRPPSEQAGRAPSEGRGRPLFGEFLPDATGVRGESAGGTGAGFPAAVRGEEAVESYGSRDDLLGRLARMRREPPRGDRAALGELLDSLGGGWAARRVLSTWLRERIISDLDEALELIEHLEGDAARGWCLADLLHSWPLDKSQRRRVLAAAPGPAWRRRLSWAAARTA